MIRATQSISYLNGKEYIDKALKSPDAYIDTIKLIINNRNSEFLKNIIRYEALNENGELILKSN